VAADRAVRAGADPATVTLVDQEDIPIAYLPGNSLRVRARVVGDVRG
jgi:N-methylhydantoinase A/oxoprolinase/acetone carboxylase beta subunit